MDKVILALNVAQARGNATALSEADVKDEMQYGFYFIFNIS